MFFDFVSIIIVIGLLQGVLMVALLLFQKGKNANIFLIGVLMFLLWTQLEFLFVRNKIQSDLVFLFATRLGSWLVLGPLFLYYTKSIVNINFSSSKNDILHFAPFIIFTLLIPFSIRELIPDRAIHYGILSLLKYYNLGTTPIQAFYAILFILQFVHLSVYLIWSKRIVKVYATNLKAQFSNPERVNAKWISNLIGLFMLVLLSISIFFVILFIFNIYKREFDYLYVIPSAFVIYWIAFKIIMNPEIIRPLASEDKEATKYQKSSLTTGQAIAYKELVSSYMITQKPYLNNELKLNDLANDLKIHPHHLSQVLNDQFDLSFFDFVNQYRIEEAKMRFKQKNGEAILQIAYEVGFNNKASFNNYFKKITSKTPSKFIKEHLS